MHCGRALGPCTRPCLPCPAYPAYPATPASSHQGGRRRYSPASGHQAAGGDNLLHPASRAAGGDNLLHPASRAAGGNFLLHPATRQQEATISCIQPPGQQDATISCIQPPGQQEATFSCIQPPGQQEATFSCIQPPGQQEATLPSLPTLPTLPTLSTLPCCISSTARGLPKVLLHLSCCLQRQRSARGWRGCPACGRGASPRSTLLPGAMQRLRSTCWSCCTSCAPLPPLPAAEAPVRGLPCCQGPLLPPALRPTCRQGARQGPAASSLLPPTPEVCQRLERLPCLLPRCQSGVYTAAGGHADAEVYLPPRCQTGSCGIFPASSNARGLPEVGEVALPAAEMPVRGLHCRWGPCRRRGLPAGPAAPRQGPAARALSPYCEVLRHSDLLLYALPAAEVPAKVLQHLPYCLQCQKSARGWRGCPACGGGASPRSTLLPGAMPRSSSTCWFCCTPPKVRLHLLCRPRSQPLLRGSAALIPPALSPTCRRGASPRSYCEVLLHSHFLLYALPAAEVPAKVLRHLPCCLQRQRSARGWRGCPAYGRGASPRSTLLPGAMPRSRSASWSCWASCAPLPPLPAAEMPVRGLPCCRGPCQG